MPKKSMMKTYFKYLKEYEKKYGDKTILLWQCGSFYEIYGLKNKDGIIGDSKIIEYSKILDMNFMILKKY